MSTVSQIIASGRYDLKEYKGQRLEQDELLEYLNRAVVILDGVLVSIDSDWIHQSAISTGLSTGQNKVSLPTRCASIRTIWIISVLSACTDLTFAATGDTITSVATNFATEGFAANDTIGVYGSTSNDTSSIGLLTISALSSTGGGTDNRITVNENVLVNEGAGIGTGTIIKVGSDSLTQKTLDYINYTRKTAGTGIPYYWAYEGAYIVFERQADQAYGLTIHFNQKAAALASDDNMPYGDEFNEQLRAAMVIYAKNRNAELGSMDIALEGMFRKAAMTKMIRRNFVPKPYRLDF